MSKQAAEHHSKAAEHHENAARHHREASKHHEEGNGHGRTEGLRRFEDECPEEPVRQERDGVTDGKCPSHARRRRFVCR